LLEVEHPDESVVAVLRLHDYPSEYVQPLKFGDVLIVWCPRRDAGDMSMADRTTANAVTVAQLVNWCEKHRATQGRLFRTDAADTDQSENSNLSFDYVYRKLFQAARVF
jgi:hypothetical protein